MNDGFRLAAKALGIDVEAESAEFGEVFARYVNTPQWMKAPNGKPSNLTVRQWIQVRTPAFKKMAGDWEMAAAYDVATKGVPVTTITLL